MTALAPTLQAFFTDRLTAQRGASPHTIAAYRDTLRLLLAFAADRTGTRPSELDIGDLDARADRRVPGPPRNPTATTASATRNHRLAAIHSLFAYAALPSPRARRRHPAGAGDPSPNATSATCVTYLTEEEIDALLAACDQTTWTGRRDHAMLVLAVQTGLRVSELISLACADVILGTGAHVRCIGKGRKAASHATGRAISAVLRRLARRARRQPRRPAVPDHHRQAAQPRRGRAPHRPLRRHRRRALPIYQGQARHRPYPPAHRCHETPARRRRPGRHRPLARARPDLDHRPLPARRHDPERARTRPHPAARR